MTTRQIEALMEYVDARITLNNAQMGSASFVKELTTFNTARETFVDSFSYATPAMPMNGGHDYTGART